MLSDLFTQVVILSLSAALIALLVMALRLILKKAPRALICALWALVAVRLIIPVLPKSKVSVVPEPVSEGTVIKEISARPVETTVRVREYEPEYVTIITRQPQLPVQTENVRVSTNDNDATHQNISPVGNENSAAPADEAAQIKEVRYVEVSAATHEAPKTFGNTVLPVLAWIWLAGVCGMLLFMAFSYYRIRRKVRISVNEQGNLWLCDDLTSPFILGVIRPRIYLPSYLRDEEKGYVLAHEQAHLKRLDHIWKPLGFVLLSLYWFNPVMWAAYILLCRDIELACDEKVIGREGDGFKKAYSQALIACSVPQRLVTACPLAFGEIGVKTRVKSVLNYKKPAFWILAGALVISFIAAGCALTNPKNSQPSDPAESASAQESTPAGSTESGKAAESTLAESEPAQTEPQPAVPPETQPVPPESTEDPADQPQTGLKEYHVGLLKADQEGVLQADRTEEADENFEQTEPSAGYELSREGDTVTFRSDSEIWTFTVSQKDVRIWGSDHSGSLNFCVVEDDGNAAMLYQVVTAPLAPSGAEYVIYSSRIDMSDWLYIPDCFVFGDGQPSYVMAPRQDGLYFYELNIGEHKLMPEKPVRDLTGLRERILGGEVYSLEDGAEITDDFPGFSIDLDGDGVPESVTVQNGVNTQQELCCELYLNGKAAGYSHQVYRYAMESGLSLNMFYWPEEGTFRKNNGYRMYLASMDGEQILLFLSNDEQTFGIDFIDYYSNQQLSEMTAARARIRGIGKTMEDFVPNQPLEQYIADGWLVRPSDGDLLDVSGSGSKNAVRVSYEESLLSVERIRVTAPENSGKEEYQVSVAWNKWGLSGLLPDEIRYDRLYYAPSSAGGYDLLAEISVGENWWCNRYRLTDEEWNLSSGLDRDVMVFHPFESAVSCLPGRAGVSSEIAAAYEALTGYAPHLSAASLREFELYFRDDFVSHFLCEEYEDAADISLQNLFFDGPCTGFIDSQGRPKAEPGSEEYETVYQELWPDSENRLQLIKTPVSQADELLRRYIGYGLVDMRSKKMPGGYIAQYDAYYAAHGDGQQCWVQIADGVELPDGSVLLLWTWSFPRDITYSGVVRLQYTDSHWWIRSNTFLSAHLDGEKHLIPTVGMAAIVLDNGPYVSPLRSPMLRDESDGEEYLLLKHWAVLTPFIRWSLADRRVSAEEMADRTPDYTLRLYECLEISALRLDHYDTATTRRAVNGQEEYYGWINGAPCWLPKDFIDIMEEWYQTPMEEQLKQPYVSLYERVYAQASAAEREKLEALYPNDRDPWSVSGFEREILIAAGQLAEDTPRLTLEQAQAICDEVRQTERAEGLFAQMDRICERFNEFAGAPDWIGGSGVRMARYLLNEEGTAVINIDMSGGVYYWDENKQRTILLDPAQ